MEVSHPRTLHLPVVGRAIAGPLFAASIAARFTQIRHKIDVVLGTWAYPDAWASVVLGTIANVPTVVKVHGSDINVVAQKPLQRFQLARVLPKAAAVVAVSRALADEIANLGVPAENIHVIRNGVDGERFFLGDRALARRALANAHPRADAAFSQDGPVVLFVGNLKTEKGIHDLLEAWPTVVRDCPTATLCIVGGGSESERVKRQCAELPSAFAIGPVDHTEVALWMRASIFCACRVGMKARPMSCSNHSLVVAQSLHQASAGFPRWSTSQFSARWLRPDLHRHLQQPSVTVLAALLPKKMSPPLPRSSIGRQALARCTRFFFPRHADENDQADNDHKRGATRSIYLAGRVRVPRLLEICAANIERSVQIVARDGGFASERSVACRIANI